MHCMPHSLPFSSDARTQWRRNEFESGGAPVRSESGGTELAQSAGNFFLGRAPPLFTLKAQLVVLVSAFVMVRTVWSVSCSLFSYSRCPRAQPFVKVGARAPMESAALHDLKYKKEN